MPKDLSYLEAIREALTEEMRRDPKVFVLGEDVGPYGGAFGVTQGLFEEFGEMRLVDTPISESAIIGVSIGASLRGYRPVAEMQFADFISCGFDQIVNQAATLRYRYGGRASVPIVVRAPSGGNVGGGLYHSQNPEAWFIHRPGLKVVAPSTAYDAKGLLKAAIRDDNPVIYFEHKRLYRSVKEDLPTSILEPLYDARTRVTNGDAWAFYKRMADKWGTKNFSPSVVERMKTMQPLTTQQEWGRRIYGSMGCGYCHTQQVRFADRLHVNIKVDPGALHSLVPCFLLQPIVENAIKFGLYDTVEDVLISINAFIENEQLIITVQNPFDAETAQPQKGAGFGLGSVQRRLYLLFARNDLVTTTAENKLFTTTIKIPQLI